MLRVVEDTTERKEQEVGIKEEDGGHGMKMKSPLTEN
jgi:hypothetical protein